MLAAGIVYFASANVRAIETNLRQFQKAAAQMLPLPDLESDAGFRVLEECIIALCALALDWVWEHYLGNPAIDEYYSRFASELMKLGSGCGVSVSDKNLAEACLLYSSYSSAPATKEEVLEDYADYVFAGDIEELDDAALTLPIFHARILRALGVKVSVSPILCDRLLPG